MRVSILVALALVAPSWAVQPLQSLYDAAVVAAGPDDVTVTLGAGTWGAGKCIGLNVTMAFASNTGRKVLFKGAGKNQTVLDFMDCRDEAFMAFSMDGRWTNGNVARTMELAFEGISFRNQRYRSIQDREETFRRDGMGWRGLFSLGNPGDAPEGTMRLSFSGCDFNTMDAVYNGPGNWKLGAVELTFDQCDFMNNGYLFPKKVKDNGYQTFDTYGGLIYFFNHTAASATFTNSHITQSCAGYGGVVAAYQTTPQSSLTLTFQTCNIIRNMAAHAGGVVHVYASEGSSEVTFRDSAIGDNFIDADPDHKQPGELASFVRGGAVMELLVERLPCQVGDIHTHHRTHFEGGHVTKNQGAKTTCAMEGQFEDAYPLGVYPPAIAGQPILWETCISDQEKAIYMTGSGGVFHVEGHSDTKDTGARWAVAFKDTNVSENKALNGGVVGVEGDIGDSSGLVTFDRSYIMSNEAKAYGGIAFLLQRYNGTRMVLLNYPEAPPEVAAAGNAPTAFLPYIPGPGLDGANTAGTTGDAVYMSRWTDAGCQMNTNKAYLKLLGISSGPVVQQVVELVDGMDCGTRCAELVDGTHSFRVVDDTDCAANDDVCKNSGLVPGEEKTEQMRFFAYNCPANESATPKDRNNGKVLSYDYDYTPTMKIETISRPRTTATKKSSGICKVYPGSSVKLPLESRNVDRKDRIYDATFTAAVTDESEDKCYFWLTFLQDASKRYAYMEMDTDHCCTGKPDDCNLIRKEADRTAMVLGKEVPTYTCQPKSVWSTEMIAIVTLGCCLLIMLVFGVSYYRYKQRQWTGSFTRLSIFGQPSYLDNRLDEPLLDDGTELTSISQTTEIKRPWEIDFEKLQFTKRIGSGASGEVFSGTYGSSYSTYVPSEQSDPSLYIL
jgi:hypothetical protein